MLERHPGMCHLQPRRELCEVSESSKESPSRSPDCSPPAHAAPWRPQIRACTQIHHPMARFLIANPVSSASAAVACPAKRHESQGIPQQQPRLIKVRISMVGFLHRAAGTTQGDAPCGPTCPPQVPGVCFTLPGHLTSCGRSQHRCPTPHRPGALWLGSAMLGAERRGTPGAHGGFLMEPEPPVHSLLPARSWSPESTTNHCLPSGGHGDRAQRSHRPPSGSLHRAGQPDHSAQNPEVLL